MILALSPSKANQPTWSTPSFLLPYLRINENSPDLNTCLFQVVLEGSAQAEYQKMSTYMINHDLSIKEKIFSPNRVGARGYQDALWRSSSKQNLHNVNDDPFQGWIKNQPAWWPKLAQRSFPAVMSNQTHCSAKYQNVQTLANFNTGSSFTFTSWQEF